MKITRIALKLLIVIGLFYFSQNWASECRTEDITQDFFKTVQQTFPDIRVHKLTCPRDYKVTLHAATPYGFSVGVGYVEVRKKYDRQSVEFLHVNKDYRRNNMGGALLGYALAQCKEGTCAGTKLTASPFDLKWSESSDSARSKLSAFYKNMVEYQNMMSPQNSSSSQYR